MGVAFSPSLAAVVIFIFICGIESISADSWNATNQSRCINSSLTQNLAVTATPVPAFSSRNVNVRLVCQIAGYANGSKAWWEQVLTTSDSLVVASTYRTGPLSKNTQFLADTSFSAYLNCNESTGMHDFVLNIKLSATNYFGSYRCGVAMPIGLPKFYSGSWQFLFQPEVDECRTVKSNRYAIIWCTLVDYDPSKGHAVTWTFTDGQPVVLLPGSESNSRVFADYSLTFSLLIRAAAIGVTTAYTINIQDQNQVLLSSTVVQFSGYTS